MGDTANSIGKRRRPRTGSAFITVTRDRTKNGPGLSIMPANSSQLNIPRYSRTDYAHHFRGRPRRNPKASGIGQAPTLRVPWICVFKAAEYCSNAWPRSSRTGSRASAYCC